MKRVRRFAPSLLFGHHTSNLLSSFNLLLYLCQKLLLKVVIYRILRLVAFVVYADATINAPTFWLSLILVHREVLVHLVLFRHY